MRKDYDPRTWTGFGVSVILGAAGLLWNRGKVVYKSADLDF